MILFTRLLLCAEDMKWPSAAELPRQRRAEQLEIRSHAIRLLE